LIFDNTLKEYHRKAIEYQCKKIFSYCPIIDCLYDVGPAKLGTEAWFFKDYYKDLVIIGAEPHFLRYRDLEPTYPGFLFNSVISTKNGLVKGYEEEDFKLFCTEEELKNYKPTKRFSSTLDAFDKIYGPFKNIFIWADVERSELEVIKSATEMLKEKRVVGLNLEIDKESYPQIANFLNPFGFKCDDYTRYGNHGDGIFLRG